MMTRSLPRVGAGVRLAAATGLVAAALLLARPAVAADAGAACKGDGSGIALPSGFCATVFADDVGHARHMAVAPDGTLYVNTWSGRYYHGDAPPSGGFVVALKDTKGDGHADVVRRFGETPASGGHGGTGIALYKGAVYVESNDRIMRYALAPGGNVPTDRGEVIVSGLPLTGDHPMHPFMITPGGMLLVDLGSASNACQAKNRMPRVPGVEGCPEKETRAGTWRFDAGKTDQVFSPAERFATGIRNGEGFSMDAAGRMFVTQHGRDQLHENWPTLYTAQQGQDLPAEEVVELKEGADYGWPECYFDGSRKKLVLAPEYGGDGGRAVGVCAGRQAPAAFFPAHWAPNDLAFYEGTSFPRAYRGGAFIAFHGSWNRAPGPQGGYNVVFQPFADGVASGPFVVFADGFAGETKEPGQARFRPSGLAVAPDGALYISDDVHGRIWRVTYGGGDANAAAAQATASRKGGRPDEARQATDLTVPPGATAQQVALGERVFLGEAGGAACTGCHGSDAKGSPLGANLTSGKWLWSDGSLKGIAQTIAHGVPQPKEHEGAMPPMGGATLSDAELHAVASYVWAVGHPAR